jgi:hypothetical protein
MGRCLNAPKMCPGSNSSFLLHHVICTLLFFCVSESYRFVTVGFCLNAPDNCPGHKNSSLWQISSLLVGIFSRALVIALVSSRCRDVSFLLSSFSNKTHSKRRKFTSSHRFQGIAPSPRGMTRIKAKRSAFGSNTTISTRFSALQKVIHDLFCARGIAGTYTAQKKPINGCRLTSRREVFLNNLLQGRNLLHTLLQPIDQSWTTSDILSRLANRQADAIVLLTSFLLFRVCVCAPPSFRIGLEVAGMVL